MKEFFESLFNDNLEKMPKISVKAKTKHVKENENMEAPGQLLKHYSPYLPCYYLSSEKV